VFNLSVAIHDFIGDLVNDEELPEDEKEKFKVPILVFLCMVYYKG
jgi:hypothetical protein